jgi:hypothetical protein
VETAFTLIERCPPLAEVQPPHNSIILRDGIVSRGVLAWDATLVRITKLGSPLVSICTGALLYHRRRHLSGWKVNQHLLAQEELVDSGSFPRTNQGIEYEL